MLACKSLFLSKLVLYNSLQLPRIPNRILNDLSARDQDLLLVPHALPLLQGEVYPAILDHPAATARKLHDAAFALEEEEVLGVGDGEGRVGFFRARCYLRTDGADEDLVCWAMESLANRQMEQRRKKRKE